MPHGLAQPGNITVAPRVWALTGNDAKDNYSVLALAEALGWPFEIKQFVHRAHEFVPNLLRRTTLAGIDEQQSSPIEAPWPDLVICADRRNEPIARWIKQQSPDTIRLVHAGRPWGSLDDRDDAALPAGPSQCPAQHVSASSHDEGAFGERGGPLAG